MSGEKLAEVRLEIYRETSGEHFYAVYRRDQGSHFRASEELPPTRSESLSDDNRLCGRNRDFRVAVDTRRYLPK